MNPADDNEPVKKTPLLEQWWGGLVAVFFLGAIVLLLLLSKAEGADVSISWNPNPVAENVAFYQVRADEVWGIQSMTGTTPSTTYTFTGLKRGVLYSLSVVAGNAVGVSLPAMIQHAPPYKFRITDYRSSDLHVWVEYDQHEVVLDKPSQFYRRKIEYIP